MESRIWRNPPEQPTGQPTISPVNDESNLPIERAWPWVLRVAWFGLAPTLGQVLTAATDTRSTPVTWTVLAVSAVLWAAGFLATLIPHPIGLVTVRTAALASIGMCVWGALALNDADKPRTGLLALGLVWTVATAGIVLHPETGHFAVNGPAYPNERRFLLRPAAVVQGVIVPLSVVLVGVASASGPLLLAARQWIAGVVAVAVGAPLAVVLARSLFALARRFVVFVPAGFVLHDLAVLREPVLFRRQSVEAIGAASADTDALDLTLGAAGLATEIRFREKVELTLRDGRSGFREGRSARFLFVPTLPGRMLGEARRRNFPML